MHDFFFLVISDGPDPAKKYLFTSSHKWFCSSLEIRGKGRGENTEKGKTLMGLGAVMFSRYTDDELENFKRIRNGNE